MLSVLHCMEPTQTFFHADKVRIHSLEYVMKSDELPSQEEIDIMETRLWHGCSTIHTVDQQIEMSLRYMERVKVLLVEGRAVEELVPLIPQISLEAHNEWHRAKYVNVN